MPAAFAHLLQRHWWRPRLTPLTAALRTAAESRKEPFLIISADAMSTHQAVINVMDAARRAGLSRMTFAAQTANGAAAEQP